MHCPRTEPSPWKTATPWDVWLGPCCGGRFGSHAEMDSGEGQGRLSQIRPRHLCYLQALPLLLTAWQSDVGAEAPVLGIEKNTFLKHTHTQNNDLQAHLTFVRQSQPQVSIFPLVRFLSLPGQSHILLGLCWPLMFLITSLPSSLKASRSSQGFYF